MKSFTVLCNAVLHRTIFFCIIVSRVWAGYDPIDKGFVVFSLDWGQKCYLFLSIIIVFAVSRQLHFLYILCIFINICKYWFLTVILCFVFFPVYMNNIEKNKYTMYIAIELLGVPDHTIV